MHRKSLSRNPNSNVGVSIKLKLHTDLAHNATVFSYRSDAIVFFYRGVVLTTHIRSSENLS